LSHFVDKFTCNDAIDFILVGVQVGDPVAELLQNVRTRQILSSSQLVKGVLQLLHAVY
jgi:hypothetical protein